METPDIKDINMVKIIAEIQRVCLCLSPRSDLIISETIDYIRTCDPSIGVFLPKLKNDDRVF